MSAELTIKPEFKPFVVRPTFRLSLTLLVMMGGGFGLATLADAAPPGLGVGLAALFLLLVGVQLAARVVRYRKTTYSFHPERIILRTGGLIGERSVDLQLKNITQVGVTLPFVEHKLYKTGSVTIQAAGSAGTEIYMESVADPMACYQQVAERMRGHGFSLQRAREIQCERPGVPGTMLEMGEALVGVGIVVVIVALQLWRVFLDVVGGDEVRAEDLSIVAQALLVGAVGFVVLAASVWLVLRFIDLMRRTYVLYDDVIDYRDGFLTQRYRFIPIENLADVTLSQSLPRRLLGVSDLVVSCQGANTNIAFKVMPRAQEFKANLEALIRERGASLVEEAQMAPAAVEHGEEAGALVGAADDGMVEVVAAAPSRRVASARRELELRMSPERAVGGMILARLGLAGLVVLGALVVLSLTSVESVETALAGTATLTGLAFVFGAWIVRDIVRNGMAYYATRFRFDAHKLGRHYDLFKKHQVEFTLDKVTSVTVSHGLVDRLFGTANIAFRSIGSAEEVVFEHLPDGRAVARDIVERIGLAGAKPEQVLGSEFSVGGFLRARAGLLAMLGVIAVSGIVGAMFHVLMVANTVIVVAGIIAWFGHHLVYYRRCRLEIFADHLHLRRGIFTVVDHFAACCLPSKPITDTRNTTDVQVRRRKKSRK